MRALNIATLAVWLLALWVGIRALRTHGLINKLRSMLSAAVLAGLGVLLGALLVITSLFQAFSGETLVARVTTRRLSPEEFELTYLPVGEEAIRATTLRLQGDQWTISGGIVKWHPWLTALGIHGYQKPVRIGGQFSDLDQQRSHLPTVYSLEPGIDWFWERLYWADPYLPFVEAVYGSSAYVYAEPSVVQEVYVTPSGYLIKRASGASGKLMTSSSSSS